MRRFALLALTFALACGDSTGPRIPSVAGSWSGSIQVQGAGTTTFTATLAQSGGTLTGTGGFSGVTNWPITGTVTSGNIVAFEYETGHASGSTRFEGTLTSASRLDGIVINYAPENRAITFTKQ